jgi:hypothetical protein
MNGTGQSAAEDTAAFLVHAERSGSPVLIPGAFEKRAAGPAVLLRSRPEVVTDDAHPTGASGVERLEHEREGGGAPSARAGRRSWTLGPRLHSLLEPFHGWWRRPSAAAKTIQR